MVKEVGVSNTWQYNRASLPAAVARALLAFAACIPPIAFHDGLPAWMPAAGRVEGSVGYQRLSSIGADSIEILGCRYSPSMSLNYFTPGVRVGLGRGSTTADIGVASVVVAGGGNLSLLAGPVMGVGYCSQRLSVVFRPSFYLLGASTDSGPDGGVSFGNWPQATLLVGNGYRPRRVNFSAGLRASMIAGGPVVLIDYDLHPVDLRAEVSYMLPMSIISAGQTALTAGLTVAAPTR